MRKPVPAMGGRNQVNIQKYFRNRTIISTAAFYQTLNYEAPPFIPTSCIENQQHSYIANSNSDIQKFNYLKSQLGGEASHTINGFALTNANYKEAVNVLQERYGQSSKIIQAHMKALLDITPASTDLASLHVFYDRLEASVRVLEALGQSQDTYGTLLVPIILSKLPGEVRQHLAREHGSSTWTLSDLRKSIQKEINIIEAGQDYGIRQSYSTTPTCTFLVETKSYGKELYTPRKVDYVNSNQRAFPNLDERDKLKSSD
ncbi:unnamed protein product [Mytilus coruscus]|uniref:Uncharacterized protein n=1 Tax=Mytilus coruscus TaxID=42192 RepID=A0A6J8AE00_MYTCO|nr:unnamed protein product [Mytilus coruscus]